MSGVALSLRHKHSGMSMQWLIGLRYFGEYDMTFTTITVGIRIANFRLRHSVTS